MTCFLIIWTTTYIFWNLKIPSHSPRHKAFCKHCINTEPKSIWECWPITMHSPLTPPVSVPITTHYHPLPPFAVPRGGPWWHPVPHALSRVLLLLSIPPSLHSSIMSRLLNGAERLASDPFQWAMGSSSGATLPWSWGEWFGATCSHR